MSKQTKKADQKLSEGARMERAAMRKYLRRQMAEFTGIGTVNRRSLEIVLSWVLAREKRYSKRAGGL